QGAVGRDREPDADEPAALAARGGDGGVDADDLAGHVDQCTARVAGIDGRVGLDQARQRPAGRVEGEGAVQGADDALGDGPFEAQWAADREHGVADQQLVAVPERGRGQVLYAPDLYHTDVRPGVETDDRAHRHVPVADRQ